MEDNTPSGRGRVLVTGASGFYGRHVVPFLHARGFEVVAVARRAIDFGPRINSIIVSDIFSDVEWLRHLNGVEAVVHLAGLAHATSFIAEDEYDRVNRRATARIAQVAHGVGAKLIYLSSVAAQSGPIAPNVITENDEPSPTTAYGRSKLHAEEEVVQAGQRHVIFRPTLTYGEGVLGNMGRLIQLATSRVPTPFGALSNRRSLLAIENACEAVAWALETDEVLGHMFLLADLETLTVAEMVMALREGAGRKGKALAVPPALLSTAFRSLGRGDIWDRISGSFIVSVEKLKRAGFRWKIGTYEGLRALGASYAAVHGNALAHH